MNISTPLILLAMLVMALCPIALIIWSIKLNWPVRLFFLCLTCLDYFLLVAFWKALDNFILD